MDIIAVSWWKESSRAEWIIPEEDVCGQHVKKPYVIEGAKRSQSE